MQSVERHHQDMLSHQRVIPGRYNPLEEVPNNKKIEKSSFIKIKTSVYRVNSNAITQKLEQETLKNAPRKIERPRVLLLHCYPI